MTKIKELQVEGLMGRGSHYKLSASIKSWAHLAKNAILDTLAVCQFCKKGQLGQRITTYI